MDTATNGNLLKIVQWRSLVTSSGRDAHYNHLKRPRRATAATEERRSRVKMHSRMNEVGRPVNRVDDPGGIIRQDTRRTCGHRLLPDEPDVSKSVLI